jgi:hypothetical protein
MTEPTDLRGTLEAAITQEETANPPAEPIAAASAPATGEPAPVSEPAAAAPKSEPAKAEPAAKPAVVDPTDEPETTGKPYNYEKPPSSWKPIGKSKWAELPMEAKHEVVRRERQINQTLEEVATARGFHEKYEKALTPFRAHIQSRGVTDDVEMVKALVGVDYQLTNSPPATKAALMAKLIKDYGVDIAALDSALAGEPMGDPVASRVEQLLQQRLAPLQQFLQTQEQQRTLSEKVASDKTQQTIESMSEDIVKYPHFDDVREDMADLIEMSAKRGVYLTLDQAYSRAVAINPETSQLVSAQSQQELAQKQAAAANAKAQKALSASVSVSGAPNGSGFQGADPGNLRGTIASAFEQSGGR